MVGSGVCGLIRKLSCWLGMLSSLEGIGILNVMLSLPGWAFAAWIADLRVTVPAEVSSALAGSASVGLTAGKSAVLVTVKINIAGDMRSSRTSTWGRKWQRIRVMSG